MTDTPQLRAGRARRWRPWRERFWSNVDKTPGHGPRGKCWLWTGRVVGYPGNQYGAIGVEGKSKKAHRVSYELAYGPIPVGLKVLHRCDVGLCVRPSHLFVGTQADNMRDALAKGRLRPAAPPPEARARGAAHPRSRFTERDVRDIRREAAKGVTRAELARRYDVLWPAIDSIVRRRTWRHVR